MIDFVINYLNGLSVKTLKIIGITSSVLFMASSVWLVLLGHNLGIFTFLIGAASLYLTMKA